MEKKYGCYNRVRKPSYLGQAGWRIAKRLMGDAMIRYPVIVVIPDTSSLECVYAKQKKVIPDTRCSGCKWNVP